MVETIRVTGKSLELPKEIMERFGKESYLMVAHTLGGHSSFRELKRYESDTDMAVRLVEYGPIAEENGFTIAVSYLLRESEGPLEIVLDDRRPDSMHSADGKLLVVRGNVGRWTGCIGIRGASYMFVDGNVASVSSLSGCGVLYVSGDVEHLLGPSNDGILIVRGDIKKADPDVINSFGPREPSRFVFTKDPVAIYGYAGNGALDTPERTTNVVAPSELEIKPENLREKAAELVTAQMLLDIDKIKREVTSKRKTGSGDDIVRLTGLYRSLFRAGEDGYAEGFMEGLPDFDDVEECV